MKVSPSLELREIGLLVGVQLASSAVNEDFIIPHNYLAVRVGVGERERERAVC